MSHIHHHHHHDHASDTFSDRNQSHFDKVASTIFQEQWVIDLSKQIFQEMQQNVSWLGLKENTRMLDYACGDGLASRAFAENVDTVVGMDISNGMVEQYNKRMAEEGFPTHKAHAVRGDIMQTKPSGQQPFDLIVISMALHHVDDPRAMVKAFANHLTPGGVLLVIEGLKTDTDVRKPTEDGAFDEVRKTVSHSGFTLDEMTDMMKDAQLQEAKTKLFEDKSALPDGMRGFGQLFLATARKQ